LRVFTPALEVPHEVQAYSAAAQRALLAAWLVCVIGNLRPRPIATMIGEPGSGKSTLARAIMRLFYGEGGNLAPPTSDPRDLQACATRQALHVIDNLDSAIDDRLLNTLASAATGAHLQQRELYSNNRIKDIPLIASFIVTTRTGAFCQRADMADRVLPFFFGEPPHMADELGLYQEVDRNRDAMLSWLVLEACRACNAPPAAALSTNRFVAYSRTVCAMAPDALDGAGFLDAWKKAQRLAITDLDPLPEAIISHFRTGAIEKDLLQGFMVNILRTLDPEDKIPCLGGGKSASRKLRELKPTLRTAGIELREETREGRAYFTIFKRRSDVPGNP
jgi:energy-coupling factor transporter ATP-binding protein EcfA2